MHGLAGKLAAGAVQDLLEEPQQAPVLAGPGERSTAINNIRFLKPFYDLSSNQYAVGLNEGED
jgi:hypothetical protein